MISELEIDLLNNIIPKSFNDHDSLDLIYSYMKICPFNIVIDHIEYENTPYALNDIGISDLMYKDVYLAIPNEKCVKIYDLPNKRYVKIINLSNIKEVMFSYDNRYLMCISHHNDPDSITYNYLICTKTWNIIEVYKGNTYCACFSHDSSMIIISHETDNNKCMIMLYDLIKKRVIMANLVDGLVNSCKFSPNNKKILFDLWKNRNESIIWIYEIDDYTQSKQLVYNENSRLNRPKPFFIKDSNNVCFAINNTIYNWKSQEVKSLYSITNPNEPCNIWCYSPDHKYYVIPESKLPNNIMIIEAETSTLISKINIPCVISCKFSTDGRYLIARAFVDYPQTVILDFKSIVP